MSFSSRDYYASTMVVSLHQGRSVVLLSTELVKADLKDHLETSNLRSGYVLENCLTLLIAYSGILCEIELLILVLGGYSS